MNSLNDKGSSFHLNILRSYVYFRLFEILTHEHEREQILYSISDDLMFTDNCSFKYIYNEIDYNKYEKLDIPFNEYMYYKYGMYNKENLLYLVTNNVNELFAKIPFENTLIPIEYKPLVDLVKEYDNNVGEYKYIDNILKV